VTEGLGAEQAQYIVIGGGPAGLTAAYELTRRHRRPIVLEKLDKLGGIARTEAYKGFHFDMGGHRFYTKSAEVDAFWHEILGDDFLRRPRLSRIYYNGKFFNYPLKPKNALLGLGPFEGVRIVGSYLRWQLFPYPEEESFEQWVTNRFGRRLFQTFFESYTEKVWGISCKELKAEWAAQRIKDLSLRSAILTMFFKPQKTIKTLIEEFDYPRQGPGMLWTAVGDRIVERGGEVCFNSEVVQLHRDGNRITGIDLQQNGDRHHLAGDHFISTMPLPLLLQRLDPPPPPHILQAARQLKHRDFLTVCLIIDRKELFPDNWIYIHDPDVQVGRIQNYKNWSHDMVPDLEYSSLGLEYFCNIGDDLWTMPDEELVELGRREIAQIGLAAYDEIIDGTVFRVEHTYPVYDADYAAHLETIKRYMATFDNLQTIGRNGLHRYNNQDHTMLTGMYAIRNHLEGTDVDLWQINAEQAYLEELLEEDVSAEEVVEVIKKSAERVFPKLDAPALGLSLGLMTGVLLAVITLFAWQQGDPGVVTAVELINQFYPGYTVTLLGAVIGFLYAFVTGYLVGWFFAFLRNVTTAFYLSLLYRSTEKNLRQQFFELV
jgi:protoporphyrinogen oxidase